MKTRPDFYKILDRIAQGVGMNGDIEAIWNALQRGEIRIETGTRSVTTSGDINDSVIITGDGNIIYQGPSVQDIANEINKLNELVIDYEAWKIKQHTWIQDGFQDETISCARFGQVLNLADPGIQLIERQAVWETFDQWYTAWATTQRTLVVLGEEGDGKTWAVGAWINQHIAADSTFPPVIFLGSERINSTNSKRPEDILTTILQDSEAVTSENLARQMLAQWKNNDNISQPWMICILDGINQHHDPGFWRLLIAQLTASPWKQRIALVITARMTYWQENFTPNNNLWMYTIPTYNDQELNTALTKYRLTLGDLAPELHSLARRPRFLSMLVKHRDRMTQSRDITVARLMYEDWRDRYERKMHFPLNESDFHNMLAELAERYRQGIDRLYQRDLQQMLPDRDRRVLDELCTSGIFRVEHGKYKVQSEHLALGLALLLIEQLQQASESGMNATEAIAQWMEPHTAIDLKGLICERAVLIAFKQQSLSIEIKAQILFSWITHQNIAEKSYPRLASYFNLSPASYFALAERIWASANNLTWAKQALLKTFLDRIKSDHQKGEFVFWQDICERWLGFICRFDYILRTGISREKQSEEAYSMIINRLGITKLEEGPFIFQDYNFTVVDDKKLLQLNQVALTLISHVSRLPFIRALAIGVVAATIVRDFPRNYQKFAWVIRSSEELLWDKIKTEVDHLFTARNKVAIQSASWLLTFAGSHQAMEMKATFPMVFPPKDPRDPCSFTWQRQDCEECMARSDIEANRVAYELSSHCIDPTLPQLPSLIPWLIRIANSINVTEMNVVLGQTSADNTFESYESILCVYAPEVLAEVIRRLVADIPYRSGMALRRVAYELRKHMLLFSSEEQSIIDQVWIKLCAQDHQSNEEEEIAEWWLFELRLSYMSDREQLKDLLQRPENSKNLKRYTYLFESPTVWNFIWEKLEEKSDDETINRLIWFIGVHSNDIPSSKIVLTLVPLLQHKDSFIRAMILEIIYHTKDFESIEYIITSGWSWSEDFCIQENNLGSLILCEHGGRLPFPEIISRVFPSQLGYAIQCRNFDSEEAHLLSNIVHDQWLRLTANVIPSVVDIGTIVLDLPDGTNRTIFSRWRLAEAFEPISMSGLTNDLIDEPKILSSEAFQEFFNTEKQDQQWKEQHSLVQEITDSQRAAANYWFDQPLYAQDFDPIYDIHPERVEEWIEGVLNDSTEARQRLNMAGSFYDALCILSLRRNTSMGLKLYWKIFYTPMHTILQDENTKVWSLDYALFEASRSPITEESWQRRIKVCTNDASILEVVIAVQAADQTAWLLEHIEQLLANENSMDFLRAITLMGLLDVDSIYSQFQQLLIVSPDSWVRDSIMMSIARSQHNSWSKHWFHRFITIPEDVSAWASFQLFLRCVDRRFWGWSNDMMERFPLTDTRRRFLILNDEVIKQNIDKNEKQLNKQYLCQKITDKQLWPWIKGAE